jgi:hypothetical protein
VVTLLGKRQSMMRQHIMRMHDQMMLNMMKRIGAARRAKLFTPPRDVPRRVCVTEHDWQSHTHAP